MIPSEMYPSPLKLHPGGNALQSFGVFDVVDAYDREEDALEREEASMIVREILIGVQGEVRGRYRTRRDAVSVADPTLLPAIKSPSSGVVAIDGALQGRYAPRDGNVARLLDNGFRVWVLERAGLIKDKIRSCVVTWAIGSAAELLEDYREKATDAKFTRCVEISC
jgi:hypothetical protein